MDTLRDQGLEVTTHILRKSKLYVRRGDTYMERGDHEHAIQSFERARLLAESPASVHLEVISLVSVFCSS